MNKLYRIISLLIWIGVPFVLSVFWLGNSDVHTNQANAAHDAIEFEIKAGYIGRSELYAREQYISGFTLPDAATLPQLDSPQTITTETLTQTSYLPFLAAVELSPMVERRGLWVTRYDWTSYGQTPVPGDIEDIVANASTAGFNTIFFQVRAAGDSFYSPTLEPWSARLTTGPVSETLGVDPGWDPLAVMLQTAHAAGIEAHAYVNVYTAWLSPPDESQGQLWPPATTPAQMFDIFTYSSLYTAHPGLHGLGYTWRQYENPDSPMPLVWNHYLWASPGVDQVQDHIADVVSDILSRYAVDGIHLDLVRYAGSGYSYDPFSNTIAGTMRTPDRDQWQRDRITTLVSRISIQAHKLRPNALVSAAVWPVYVDKWGWGVSGGYDSYFQDSKGWLQNGFVDAIAPMLYGGVVDDANRWQILMEDFIASQTTGQTYPGIGVYEDFSVISERISFARNAGAPGHVIFSYSGINQRGFWDELASGPYQRPAVIPTH
jgi:uncharacterized lipoprotein YddW (UPF0748 family)